MDDMYGIGFDIGGTKCAVSLGLIDGGSLKILSRSEYPTAGGPGPCLARATSLVEAALASAGIGRGQLGAIGISCGGPLDLERGLVLSPPNLGGWDGVEVVEHFRGLCDRVVLQNDANASALAEWRYGAGRGLDSLVFLTFGTGLGAGIILGGRLWSGASGMAGELGHIRLADFGPVGYGKTGSFEGFCSGGGIAQLARIKVAERLQRGETVSLCAEPGGLDALDAKTVAEAARRGDSLAIEILELSGTYLGRGLSILVDLLNPEAIILGGIFMRCEDFLRPAMEGVLARESLGRSLEACRIMPAGLGERVGDYAALAVAFHGRDGGRAS
ncbi:MAG TPA: ROK family protein [Rectinemataceae bacterium]|nr:ROK family protein [Rectinemataceae bacterium]